MSTNSIRPLDDESLAKKYNRYLCTSGNQYMVASRFMVGEKPNLDKWTKIETLYRIYKNQECYVDCIDFETVKEELNQLLS